MTTGKPTTPSPAALRAAHAIINSTVNPALRHDAQNCNARNLATIIDAEYAAERKETIAAHDDAIRELEESARQLLADLKQARRERDELRAEYAALRAELAAERQDLLEALIRAEKHLQFLADALPNETAASGVCAEIAAQARALIAKYGKEK